MADFDYYGADYGFERSSRLVAAVRNFGAANWVGALTSLTLTAGMAVWAIDLTFRDVSGVPVVRAIEGPMRIAPEEPGGRVAQFQGLALADITSGGSASPAPDQIVLAPPPVALDAPSLSARIAAVKSVPESGPEAAAVPELAIASAKPVTIDPDAVEMALSEALSGVIETGAGGAGDDTTDTEFMESADATLAATVPGIASSARPTARPDGLRRVSSLPTDAPAQVEGVQVASLDPFAPISSEVDPASLSAGTRVVQLGAFDSEAVARSEWERLDGRFGDYLDGKSQMIQKATSGGRDFWRLRVAGFDDASDARRFCAELLARDAACIPVTMR